MTINSSLSPPPMHTATETTSRVFPGVRSSVPKARAFVREALAAFPGVDVAELLTSELVTNSVLHSVAGAPGRTFMVRIVTPGTRWVRVEVSDPGPLPVPAQSDPADGLKETGRGCLIVKELADASGHDGHGLAWFRLDWSGGTR